jgi:hypothetical protein
MPEKTERSNCRFSIQQSVDGRPVLVINLFQNTISSLKNSVIGFDLLGGLPPATARKLADMMNEHILDLFVSSEQSAS